MERFQGREDLSPKPVVVFEASERVGLDSPEFRAYRIPVHTKGAFEARKAERVYQGR